MLQNKIKIEITKIFGEMLINPDKSLHRILYYVKNGDGDTRILIENINFVNELIKLYGEEKLIIIFTQSINFKIEEKILY